MSRVTIKGYGQVELNNVAFRRDGRIEAQCKPDKAAFAAKHIDYIENGMLLAVDNVKRVVAPATDASLPIALVYSAEHMYDERANALKDFKLNLEDDFLPRLGYLAVGDKFTTNCLAYEGTLENLNTALDAIATTPLYGGIDASGAIAISTTKPTAGPVLKVIQKTTMPDTHLGVKFHVLAD